MKITSKQERLKREAKEKSELEYFARHFVDSNLSVEDVQIVILDDVDYVQFGDGRFNGSVVVSFFNKNSHAISDVLCYFNGKNKNVENISAPLYPRINSGKLAFYHKFILDVLGEVFLKTKIKPSAIFP